LTISRLKSLAWQKFKHFAGKTDNAIVTRLYYRLLNSQYKTQFIKLDEEISAIYRMISSIPADFDIVVGIPRSGLFTASLISTTFGKPLSTPDLITQGKYWVTKTGTEDLDPDIGSSRLLLVDDSAGTGESIRKAMAQIQQVYPGVEIQTFVSWLSHNSDADYFAKEFPNDIEPTWLRSLAHNKFIPPVAYDLDGVLCHDYDGGEYDRFLCTVKPFRIPIYEIDYIITGRKEKHREVTEHWLQEHMVKYRQLLMCPEHEHTVDFKIRMVRQNKPGIFIESNPAEAAEINWETGIRVICVGNETMYG
jgi:uncharacterized HAD superfamily protein